MRTLRLLTIASLLATVACGGGDDTGDPTGPPAGGATNGSWTVQIDGPTWVASGTVTVTKGASNFIGLGGSGYAGSIPYSLILSIANATGPGTHSFNIYGGGGDGSSLIIGGTNGGWGTAFQGGSGSVTITVLTATRIAGNFTATLVPGSGAATGTKAALNGQFDVTY